MENSNKFIRLEDSPEGNMRFVKREPDHGYMGGYYLKTEGEASDEEIALMKDTVVEEICNEIRKIAKERDDFFIIKRGANLHGLDDTIVTTVAAKYILPTVKTYD